MTPAWWCSRFGLSAFWALVMQVVAGATGDLLPWWLAVLGGLAFGFLGTAILVFGWKVATGAES